MNESVRYIGIRNPGILPFFEFGTAPAVYWVSTGDTVKQTQTYQTGDTIMTATNTANRFAAAAFSVIISAATFAYAIIPASPNLMV